MNQTFGAAAPLEGAVPIAIAWSCVAWSLIAWFACVAAPLQGAAEPAAPAAPIRVVATVGMVGDMVKAVGGERVQVRTLMGPGVDPHLYKPTRDDVSALMDAQVVFHGGLMLEGKMTETLERMGRRKPVVAVTSGLPADRVIHPQGAEGHPDPHVWMDVSLWGACGAVVAETLARADPAGAEGYRSRAAAWARECGALHEYGKRVLATVPEKSRILVTSHDAFRYFGRAYGLRVEGVQGISTESEAGLQRIRELVGLVSENGVQAVFVESSVPRKSIEAIVEGAKARGHTLRVGGELFSDAMGNAGTWEGTYLGMLDHNITMVARALGGTAPEGGWKSERRP